MFTFHLLLKNEHWPHFFSLHKELWPKDILSLFVFVDALLPYLSYKVRLMHEAPSGVGSGPFEELL